MSLKTMPWIGCTLLALALAAAGCSQNTGKRAPQGQAGISEEAARRERERPRIEAPPAPPPLPVVPSQGNCAPPVDNIVILGSCCNNTPCNGQCVAAAGEKIECTCFDVRGGCPEGQVCCKFRRGCTRPNDCEPP